MPLRANCQLSCEYYTCYMYTKYNIANTDNTHKSHVARLGFGYGYVIRSCVATLYFFPL